MFESKEEVKKAMMDLKIFGAMENIDIDSNVAEDDQDEYEEMPPQVNFINVWEYFRNNC